VTGTLALAGSFLYAPTTEGLVAVDAATGMPLWSSPLAATGGVAIAGGSPYVTTTDARLVGFSAAPPPTVTVHDLAITGLEVAPSVSRSMDAPVKVVLANHGTATENFRLLVRVQPGRVLIQDATGTMAPGETRTVSFTWSTSLMGDDGPKTLVAELFLVGQTDSKPEDNTALQLVTVGP
jgi:hypothetical protein